MEIEKSIIEKAKGILDKRDQIRAQILARVAEFNLILKAGICPTCGENLIVDDWDHVACPNKHPIISPEGYNMERLSISDDEYDGRNSPNEDIRESYLKHKSFREDHVY